MTLKGLEKWIEVDLPVQYTEIGYADIYAAGLTGLRKAQSESPVRTGRLRRSIVLNRGGTDTHPSVSIGSSLDYAEIQEERRGYLQAGADAMAQELKQRGYA